MTVLHFKLENIESIKEDDIKLQFYSQIILPILKQHHLPNHYQSEYSQTKAGRPDGKYHHILFEYKDYDFLALEENLKFTLFGNDNYYGVYDYLLSEVNKKALVSQKEDNIIQAITKPVCFLFDGVSLYQVQFEHHFNYPAVNLSFSRTTHKNLELKLTLPVKMMVKSISFKDLSCFFLQTFENLSSKQSCLEIIKNGRQQLNTISKNGFIGREKELRELSKLVNLKKIDAKLIGIGGRRRVGKTTLVNEYIKRNNFIYLNFVGNSNLSSLENLRTCKNRLKEIVQLLKNDYLLDFDLQFLENNWQSFFFVLNQLVEKLKELDKKVIIFFDEICWFSKKSNFINDFANSWNMDLIKHEHLIVIMAGSSSSWMKEKIFGNSTVLYNRLTGMIHLKPFSLKEIGRWIKNINHSISYFDIIQYYCVFGGVISYYHYFDFNLNFKENIQNLFTIHLNKLILEHDILYKSLFEHKRKHEMILNKLVQSKSLEHVNIDKNGGSDLYKDLKELEENDLISIYKNEKGTQVYQLYDLFSLFFVYWIKKEKYKTFSFENGDFNYWKGFAFEILVLNQFEYLFDLKQGDEIKLNHKIKKIKSHQIDLMLFTEQINYVIEIKNYNDMWNLYSKDVDKMKDRIFDLENEYDGKKTELILISSNGAKISDKFKLPTVNINVSEKLKDLLNS